MYLFAGAWTILWSLVVLYMIPDSPRTASRWFTPAERRLLVARTQSNRTGRTELSSFDWAQAKEAALDIKIWLFLVMAAGIYVCNGAVTAFATQIIKSFGYTSLETIALSIPGESRESLPLRWYQWKLTLEITLLQPVSLPPSSSTFSAGSRQSGKTASLTSCPSRASRSSSAPRSSKGPRGLTEACLSLESES
jgi:hypothetical protein